MVIEAVAEMSQVEKFYTALEEIRRPKFDHELIEIGKLSTVEEKSLAMRGRLDLAVNALLTWDQLQGELRSQKNIKPVGELINDEINEVTEKLPLEIELVARRDKRLQWYARKRAPEYWEVANEMADVLVLLVAEMKLNGLTDAEVFDAVCGRAHHHNKSLINEMIARTSALGMDLSEIIILKTEINVQHRDFSLLSEFRGEAFMKKMRGNIGKIDSQIPHLSQGFLGETVLTRLQSPAYSSQDSHAFINLLASLEGDELLSIYPDSAYGNLHREFVN